MISVVNINQNAQLQPASRRILMLHTHAYVHTPSSTLCSRFREGVERVLRGFRDSLKRGVEKV